MSDGFSSPPVGMKNRQNDIILVTPPQRLSLILVREVLVCVCVSACEQKVCWGSIEYPAFSFILAFIMLVTFHVYFFFRYVCVHVRSHFICIRLFAALWSVAPQAPLSMGILSRQEYWSGLPCPPPGDLPSPGIKPASLCLLLWQTDSLPLVPPGKPFLYLFMINISLYHGGLFSGSGICFLCSH